jgi:hypothetical protein
VRVDEARHHRITGQVYDVCLGRNVDPPVRCNGDDHSVADQESRRRVWLQVFARQNRGVCQGEIALLLRARGVQRGERLAPSIVRLSMTTPRARRRNRRPDLSCTGGPAVCTPQVVRDQLSCEPGTERGVSTEKAAKLDHPFSRLPPSRSSRQSIKARSAG